MKKLLEPETFDLPANNPSEETLRRWRDVSVAKIPHRRRFRFTSNLKKREEAEELMERIRRFRFTSNFKNREEAEELMERTRVDDSIRKAAKKAEWLPFIVDIPGSLSGTTSHEVSTQKIHFRIPHTLAEGTSDEDRHKYYEPRVVSIGPRHYGRTDLEPMEKIKRKAVKELLLTSNKNSVETVAIEEVYESVEQDLLSARDCYDEPCLTRISDRDKWCQMMFRDGCFIIYFTTGFITSQFNIMNDFDGDLVWRDLILLENQLPFQVLSALARAFKCEKLTVSRICSTLHSRLLTQSFYKVVPHQVEAPVPVHLLEYYRHLLFYISNSEEQAEEEEEEDHLAVCSPFSVTELKKVGIRCSWTSNLMNFNPKHIHLKSSMFSGKLFLPQLIIDKWTMILFYNLVAYEYSCSLQNRSLGISSYLSFMSMLINGEEDVKELRARGVVQLNLKVGDDEVINFLRDITARRVPNPQDFKDVKRQISTYFKSKRLPLRVAYAEFKQRYFSGLWSFLVFLAVIFTVGMAVIQTVFTGIQTFKKID